MMLFMLNYSLYPEEVLSWVGSETSCVIHSYTGYTYLVFHSTEEAILFRLKWGCYKSPDPFWGIVYIGEEKKNEQNGSAPANCGAG